MNTCAFFGWAGLWQPVKRCTPCTSLRRCWPVSLAGCWILTLLVLPVCLAERELTSPSRLRTHDSTGSGSRQCTGSKQAAKRRRTSSGRAASSQHA